MRKTKKAGHPAWIWMAAAAILAFAGISACAADPARIEPGRKGSIKLTLYDQESGSALSDGVLALYKIASLQAEETDAVYTYTTAFADCTISLAGLSQPSLAGELEAWATAHAVSAAAEASPDADGCVVFSDLLPGLYLIRQSVNSTGYEQILPFLVTLPFPEEETWIYDVDAGPKVELLRAETEAGTKPEEETETETETEKQTGGPSAASGEAPGGPRHSAKTEDATPVAGMLCLFFAGAALLAALGFYRRRTRRG